MHIEEKISQLFVDHGLTLGLAESCTGGAIASRLTRISGASQFFLGSIVSYSNLVKENILRVKHNTIQLHGVVSDAVSKEMAQGALTVLGCDVALSVTGLAGPTGGSTTLPLGSVYISIADQSKIDCYACQFSGTRLEVIEQATQKSLSLIESYFNSVGPSR